MHGSPLYQYIPSDGIHRLSFQVNNQAPAGGVLLCSTPDILRIDAADIEKWPKLTIEKLDELIESAKLEVKVSLEQNGFYPSAEIPTLQWQFADDYENLLHGTNPDWSLCAIRFEPEAIVPLFFTKFQPPGSGIPRISFRSIRLVPDPMYLQDGLYIGLLGEPPSVTVKFDYDEKDAMIDWRDLSIHIAKGEDGRPGLNIDLYASDPQGNARSSATEVFSEVKQNGKTLIIG